MWIDNKLKIFSDNSSDILLFIKENKKIKNKGSKKEKVLSRLSFELSVPIQFQKSKEGWQLEQCKKWGCIGIHKDSYLRFNNTDDTMYQFKTKKLAPIIWLIKVSKLEKYKNIDFLLRSDYKEKTGILHIKGGVIFLFKELETDFNFCSLEKEIYFSKFDYMYKNK
tara:strand:- start:385 stop:882 length:498 start_codon:yes stop_codon:yes gene_type:complete